MNTQNTIYRSVCLILLGLLLVCGIDLIRSGLHTGGVLATFSTPWFTGIAVYTVFALVLGVVLAWGLLKPDLVVRKTLERSRGPESWIACIGVGLVVLAPPVVFLGPAGGFLTAFHYRLLALSLSTLGIAALLPADRNPLWKRLSIGAILAAGVYGIALRLVNVTDYPFKLGWSEGNRLWDYSLYFIHDAYDVAGTFQFPAYLTPGRHGLWGLPFLIPKVTITVLRLWDAMLWFIPPLVLGFALFQSARKSSKGLNLVVLVFLTFLYVNQGPIYAPLIISAAIIAFGVHPEKPVRSLVVTAFACFYAGISRWTWFVAPALWSGLIYLLEKEASPDHKWWQRILWPVIYGLSGLGGGLLSLVVTGHSLIQGGENSSIAFSQPLLWYRLFPNATYPEGVLLALFLAVGPLAGLLLWGLLSRRIRWDGLQLLGAAGVLLSTLIVGLVISVKIGGGNNLHNLDMFLLSTLFISAAGLRTARAEGPSSSEIPALVFLLIALLVFIPSWHVLRTGGPLELPSDDTIRIALRDIEDVVYARSHEGEILFLDQRQLLTFGDIRDVPFIMEHELKDLTNRAMSGEPALFADYYADLESQRFSLIVTGHLPTSYTDSGHPFSEEDNAQYKFIYQPLFAYYEVVRHFEDVGVWLLVPIRTPAQ